MRTFVGVDLPAPVLEGVPAPRADQPSHLTLLFLGDVEEAQMAELARRFRAAVAPFPPFDVELRGLGVFPNATRPRILWAGIGQGSGELIRIAAALRAAVGTWVPAGDRPFAPHLTLLRVRGTTEVEASRTLMERHRAETFSTTRVSEVLLKSSELDRSGAVHRVVDRFPLIGTTASPAAVG